MRTRYLLLLLATAAAPVQVQEFDCRATSSLPRGVQPFVERGSCAIELESADLDRDGRADYVLVLERLQPHSEDEGRRRSLLVLTAAGAGYRMAARNDGAVLCTRCGGIWGDPFDGVMARPGGFTVGHYAGSAWRWRADFTFAYSRRDRAWQLVRVSQLSYHTSDPDKQTTRVSRPPRDFGKIDLRGFDAARWLERDR